MTKKMIIIYIFSIIPMFSISLIGSDVGSVINGLDQTVLQGAVKTLGQIPEQLIKNMPESLSKTSLLAGTGLFLILLGGYYVSKNVKKMSGAVKEAYEKIQKSLLGTFLGMGAIYGGGVLFKAFAPLAGGAFSNYIFPG